jgi:hypothetical protein
MVGIAYFYKKILCVQDTDTQFWIGLSLVLYTGCTQHWTWTSRGGHHLSWKTHQSFSGWITTKHSKYILNFLIYASDGYF